MTFNFAQIEFEGPGLSPHDLKDEGGVFLLLHHMKDGSYELLDFGQFEHLRSSWASVDFDYFRTSHSGPVSLAVHYYPGWTRRERTAIIRAIGEEYQKIIAMAVDPAAILSGHAS